MKLLKPNWVHHDDNPIFSIDVHPDSSRFATGGQGKDSGRIVIWNMGPVIDPKQETDPNTPRVLCQMDHHIACVNVVRWSNNGLFLASGSDDKLIMIWNFVSGGSYENIENWKCGYTLRAHNGDVLDLAWSAKDQFLASCSVDNTIIIWNALKFPDIITRINAHNGFVKGVAWDPVGTFFASQSDDKTLKIWKTLDWTLEKSIEEPFKDCTGTTHVLRLNWSPDGQLVISAHAINNGAPTAQIIDRTNKWNTKLDFVGHRKAVTAVRFYPQIMKEEETKAKKTYCVCALGSRDRTLSVWLTKTSRPLCVVHDLFDNPVVDLAWSKRPKPALLACSMDGTIVCIEFEHSEIGYPLSKPETEEFFMNKYNYDVNATISIKDTNVPQFNAASAAAAKEKEALKFIENYDILLAQEKKQNELLEKKQQQQMKFEDSSQSTNMTTTSSNTQTLEAQKQIERRLPDGRRRITPICVSKPGEYDTPRPFGSIVGGGTHPQFERHGFSSSIGFGGQSSSNLLASPSSSSFVSRTATEQSTIIVEKRDERDQIVEVSPVKSIVYVKSGSLLGPPSTSAGHNSNNSSDVVFTAKTTSGAPQLITTEKSTESDKQSSTKPVISTEMKPQQQSQPKAAPSTPSASKPTSTSQPPPSKSTPSIPKPSTTTSTKPTTTSTSSKDAANNKPTATTSSTNQKQPQQQQPKPTTATNKPTTATAQDTNKRQQDVEVVTATSNATTVSASEAKRPRLDQSVSLDQRYLIPLRIEANSSTRIHKHDNKKITLVIENSVNITPQQQHHHHHHSNEENENKVSLLKCFENDKVLKWQHCFFSRICEVTCNKYYVSCVCEDATLSLIKLNQGTQVCCPIVLDSRAAVLNSSLNYCMCLTSNAYLYVWRYFDSSGDNNHISDSEAGNFFNLTALISQLPCQFLLRDRALNKAFITDSGVPVLQMSGSKSYFYSTHTKSWHLIPMSGLVNGPSSASKIQLSLASSTQFDGGESSASLSLHHHHHHHNWPLDEIQARQHSSNLLKIIETMNKTLGQQSGGELFSSSNSIRNDFTISYLESQINAAAGLNSAKEYKFWLVTYARYLIEHDNQDKLNELCYFLLGPLYSTNWNENVMIYKKRNLLKEILPIVAQNVAMQRIYIFFKKQLNLAETMGQKSTFSVLDRIKASSSNSNFSSKLQQNSSKMRSLETLLQPKSAQPEETITTEENMETDEQKTERAIKPDENQAQTQPQTQPQTSESKPSSVEVEMEVESVKENGSSNHVENENEEEKSVEQPVILVKDQSQQEEKQQEQPEQQSEAIIEQKQSETIIEQPVDNQNQDENKQ